MYFLHACDIKYDIYIAKMVNARKSLPMSTSNPPRLSVVIINVCFKFSFVIKAVWKFRKKILYVNMYECKNMYIEKHMGKMNVCWNWVRTALYILRSVFLKEYRMLLYFLLMVVDGILFLWHFFVYFYVTSTCCK